MIQKICILLNEPWSINFKAFLYNGAKSHPQPPHSLSACLIADTKKAPLICRFHYKEIIPFPFPIYHYYRSNKTDVKYKARSLIAKRPCDTLILLFKLQTVFKSFSFSFCYLIAACVYGLNAIASILLINLKLTSYTFHNFNKLCNRKMFWI